MLPVALFTIAGVISAGFLPLAVVGVLVFWPMRWVAHRRLSLRTPLDWAVGLLMLMVPVSLWATTQYQETVTQSLRLLLGIFLFYAVVNWTNSPQRLSGALLGFHLLLIALSGVSLVSVEPPPGSLPLLPASWQSRIGWLAADQVNPNVMAGYLVMLAPLAVSFIVFRLGDIPWRFAFALRIPGSFALIAGILTLWWTQSRGAMLGLGAALLVLICLRWRWGWLSLLVVTTIAGILFFTKDLPAVIELFASSATLGGINGRLEVWSRAIYMVQDFPFTGVGMGSFTQIADRLYPFFLYEPGVIRHAHSLFLQVAVDLGVPGLVAWLAAWIVVFIVALRIVRVASGAGAADRWMVALGAGLFAGLAAAVVHGATDAVTWGQVRASPLVWAFWGLTVAASNLQVTNPATFVREELSNLR